MVHTYEFGSDCKVDHRDILPEVHQSLKQYESEYERHKPAYFEKLHGRVRHSIGVPYALFRDPEDSYDEAVVFNNPWGTPIKPDGSPDEVGQFLDDTEGKGKKKVDSNSWGKLIFADFLHETLKQAGITDAEGNSLSVIAISSPSMDRHGVNNSASFRENHSTDNILTMMGVTSLEICEREGFDVLNLAGVSQGSAVTGEMLRKAHMQGFDINGSLFSETPTFTPRGLIDFAKRYMLDTRDVEIDEGASWIDDGPAPRVDIAEGGDDWNMRNVYGNGNALTNLVLARAMSRGGFSDVLESAAGHDVPVAIEYGKQSKVSEGMPDFLASDEAARHLSRTNQLALMISDGTAPHAHTENIVALTDMVLRSLKFARSAA